MRNLFLCVIVVTMSNWGCKDKVSNSTPDYDGLSSISITLQNIPEDYRGDKLYVVTLIDGQIFAAAETESQDDEVVMASLPETSKPFDLVLYIPESRVWSMNEDMSLGYYSTISGITKGVQGYEASTWSFEGNLDNASGGILASVEVEFDLPADLQLFAGEILNIDASIANNSEGATITNVQYLFDGVEIATYTESPYNYKLNTLGLTPDEYQLVVEVENSLGYSATDEASFRILESEANEAPFVSIQSPSQGAILTQGNIYDIIANVTDDEGTEGIAAVEFIVAGSSRSTLNNPPWLYLWNTATNNTGTIEIRVIATDINGSSRHDVINVSLMSSN